MQKILSGKNDFTAFRSSSCSAKSPIRTLKQIIIKKSSNGLINISFVSKSFLQQQVRSMVGCLKFVGEGKWDLKRLKKTLHSKKKDQCVLRLRHHLVYILKKLNIDLPQFFILLDSPPRL